MKYFSRIRKDRWLWYVIAPLIVVVASLLLENKYRYIQHCNNVSTEVARLSNDINESNFSLAQNNIKSLASMQCVKKTAKGILSTDNLQVLSALDVIKESSGAEMAYVMNEHGQVVASTSDSITGLSFTGKNFCFRPYFDDAFKMGRIVYYPALGVVSKKRGLYLSYPIIDSSTTVGVVVLKTGILNYDNTLRSYNIPCAIISEDGIIYAANNESWLFKSTYNLPDSKLDFIKDSRQFDNEELLPLGYDFSSLKVTIDGEEYSVRTAPVFKGGWNVVGLFKDSNFSIVSFLVILLSFTLILSGFYYAYRISRKLIQMRKYNISREHYSRRVFKQIEASLHIKRGIKQEDAWANMTKTITESGAEVLNIDRSAIWLFSESYNELICEDLYVKSTKEHTKGGTKNRENFQKYFSILLRDEIIVSNDLESDKELGSELRGKLDSHNITSIIHVPIFQQDKAVGVLCFEYVNATWKWNIDEQLFCERLANSIALFLLLQQNMEASLALEDSNTSLKLALEEASRSKELEKANILLAGQKAELLDALQKLKATQSQLIQYEKMASVGVLTAGVAHEINNPLNFIQGGKTTLELFVNDNFPSNKEEFKPMLDMIDSGIERASTIVNSLNHFNRTTDEYSEECNLSSIIENCLVITHNQMKHRIDVETEFSDSEFKLLGNEGKLHQVFLNILTNAQQAIIDKGIISIISKVEGNEVVVTIKDTGVGISKENINKISDPFFTTKPPGEGTGLGVSIAYNIVQEHQGTLHYQSQEGSGTTVTVSLPIVN